MSRQNIYDNDIFFQGYKKIREKENNMNDTVEKPMLFSLLPDLKNKKVLDLGCGYGENCVKFIKMGAEKVVGIDISEKMLDIAQKENSDEKVVYLNLAMEDISQINEKFDIIVSSLAFHYVENYEKLVSDIYNLMNNGGYLVFTQEHPLVTCHSTGERRTKDEEDNKMYANISNYTISGKRESVWFIDNVTIYHRNFSDLINVLIETGFKMEKIVESIGVDNVHRPDFIAFKALKD